MYVQVASYRLGARSAAELAGRINKGNIPVVRDVPGFVAYYAFEAQDGVVASVLIFEDEAGLREAEKRLAAWIETTIDEFQVTPLDVLEGDVIAAGT